MESSNPSKPYSTSFTHSLHPFSQNPEKSGKSIESQSGSETDISTSTETLSAEERHALRYTRRQEPQGQEHIPTSLHGHAHNMVPSASALLRLSPPRDESPHSRNNDSNMSMGSSTNTMIIHHSVADNSWGRRWLPSSYSTPTPGGRKTPGNLSTSFLDQDTEPPPYSSRLNALNTESLGQTLASTSLLDSSLLNASSLLNSNIYSSNIVPKTSSFLNDTAAYKLSSRMDMNPPPKYPESDLTDVQSSFLDQSEVLKHFITKEKKGGLSDDQSASSSNSGLNLIHDGAARLSKDSKDGDYTNLLNLLPTSTYSQWKGDQDSTCLEPLNSESIQRSIDKAKLSRSQPDLSRLSASKDVTNAKDLISLRLASDATDEGERQFMEIIDSLIQENNNLKADIHIFKQRVAKLQRFELEIIKVHEAHESLVKLSEHREQLERLARHKLNVEIKHLRDTNNDLKEQLEVLSNQISCNISSDSDSLKKEMNKRDVFIAQLVSQNKELIAAKERQEIELTAQRQTLNEQRTHIDILDNALTNAQTNAVKLEEEVRKKQNLVEQAGQLKRLLVSLQLAADRREHSEKSLRQKLEKEIIILRSGAKQDGSDSEIAMLRRELREKEEKIMVLEGEVTKWEQRYLQESAMRQLAIEAASMPKDAKIAALEKTSQESDRRIAQAKSDKLRHLDDIHNMNKKLTESQTKNKDLESRIAEKDAMIRVLQKRVEEKENLYQNAVRSSVGSSPSDRGSTSDLGGTPTSSTHIHSSSVSGGSSGVFTTPGTPRRDEDLGYPTQHSYPRDHLYSPVSYIPTSITLSTDSISAQNHENHPKTDRFSADDIISSRHSRPVGVAESTRFASQDLLDSDSYQDKLGVVCFPGLADQRTSARKSQQSKTLLANVRPTQHRPATPIYAFPPSIGTQMLSCPYEEIDISPPPQRKLELTGSPNVPTKNLRNPPPYNSQHHIYGVEKLGSSECIDNSKQFSENQNERSLDLPHLLPLCRKPHPPNASCNTCNIVRRSNRQNAAKMLRRANSSGCQNKRSSAPAVPGMKMVEIDDIESPSILAQLKRDWQLGGGESSNKSFGTSGSNTLPRSLNDLPRERPDNPENFAEFSPKPIDYPCQQHELSDIPINCCQPNRYPIPNIEQQSEPSPNKCSNQKNKNSAVNHLVHLKDLAAKLITQSGINNKNSKLNSKDKMDNDSPNDCENMYIKDESGNDNVVSKQKDVELIILEDNDDFKVPNAVEKIKIIDNLV